MRKYIISAAIFASLIFTGQSFCEKIYLKDGSVLDESIAYRSRGVVWVKGRHGNTGIDIKRIDKISNDDGTVSRHDYYGIAKNILSSVQAGRYEDAVSMCTVLLSSIEDANVRRLRGLLRRKAGDIKGAEEDFGMLVKDGAADPAASNNLGAIYADGKEYDKAAAMFAQAIAGDPEMVEGHNNLAAASVETKDYVRAAAEYEEVLKREPDNAAAAEALKRLKVAAAEVKR